MNITLEKYALQSTTLCWTTTSTSSLCCKFDALSIKVITCLAFIFTHDIIRRSRIIVTCFQYVLKYVSCNEICLIEDLITISELSRTNWLTGVHRTGPQTTITHFAGSATLCMMLWNTIAFHNRSLISCMLFSTEHWFTSKRPDDGRPEVHWTWATGGCPVTAEHCTMSSGGIDCNGK